MNWGSLQQGSQRVRAWMLGGAAALTLLAQWALAQDNGWLGLVLYVGAAVLFGLSVRAKERTQRHSQFAGMGQWPTDARQAVLGAGLLSVVMFLVVDPVHLRGYVWLIQVVALGLVLAGAYLADQTPRSQLDLPTSPIDLTTATTQLILAAILIGGIWVRFRNLGETPQGFWYDEADVGVIAQRITDDGYRPIFDRFLPSYDAYIIAALSKVFGHGIATVRAVSALLGVATILAGYLVGKELFGKMGGLILAFLIAFSRWSITLSRIGMNNVALPLFALLTLGFLLRGHRRQSNLDYALAGTSAGTGMLFYSSLSTSLIALGLFALFVSWSTGQDKRSLGPQVLVALVAAIVVVTPLLRFIVHDREEYLRRNGQTALWSDAGRLDNDTLLGGFKDNLARYLPMTHYNGDRNGRHNIPGEPMLPPLVAGLSALGLGGLVARTDKWLAALALVWVPLAFLPGLLSLPWEAPNTLRAVAVLPIALIIATGAIFAVARTVVDTKRTKLVLLATVAAGLAITGIADVNAYFRANTTQTEVWAVHSTGETLAAQLTKEAPESTYVQTTAFLRDSRQQSYLGSDRRQDHVFGTDTPLPLYVPAGKDALLLGTRESYDIATQAEQYYPNAEVKRDFDGLFPDLIVVRIPAADIADSLGWSVIESDGTTMRRGVLMVDTAGQYRFRTSSPVDRLVVDGVEIAACDASNVIPLAAGIHRVEITGDESAALEWIFADGTEWSSVPPERIAKQRLLPGGLLTTHTLGRDPAAAPALYETDASLDLRMHEFVLARPYQVRVTGGLLVPQTGDYEFALRTDDPLVLTLGGQELFSTGGEFVQPTTTVSLVQGTIPIEAIYDDLDGRSEIRLRWRQVGEGELVPVPQDAFVFPTETRRLTGC